MIPLQRPSASLKRARLIAACVVVVSVACGLVQLGDLALDLAHALRPLARFFGREILGLRLGDAKALMLNEQLLAIVRRLSVFLAGHDGSLDVAVDFRSGRRGWEDNLRMRASSPSVSFWWRVFR
jgi:hypothetical protein